VGRDLNILTQPMAHNKTVINISGSSDSLDKIPFDIAYELKKADHHLQTGNLQKAEEIYKKILDIYPGHPDVLHLLGLISHQLNRLENAKEMIQKAILNNTDNPIYHRSLGDVFKDQGRFDEAIKNYQKALTLKPDYADAYINMGNAYHSMGNYGRAIAAYQAALRSNPDYAEAYNNMGKTLYDQGRPEEAIQCYHRALTLKPDYAEARFNRSIAMLLTGNLAEGWEGFEWRFKRRNAGNIYPHRHERPRWDGFPFIGKRLLVHAEQGLGDTLQFARYLPLVKTLGGTVIFESLKPLTGLFDSFPGIDELLELSLNGITKVDYDYYVPLLSLPGIFRTTLDTIPNDIPYLFASPYKRHYWKDRISGMGLKVGIVWAGKPSHGNDKIRSIERDRLTPLSGIPGINLYGLQKDIETREEGFPNLGKKLDDFTDTAGIIENLDLVISVDTAVAHLAGAMGKKVWVLLPFVPDWRWLLDREDSPWYPTMRLFRQERPDDWDEVIHRVAAELRVRTERPAKKDSGAPFDISAMHIDAEIHNAIRCHPYGRIKEAEKICEKILGTDRDQPDALHRAADFAIHKKVENQDDYITLGDVLRDQGKLLDSISCYRKALQAKPDFADAYYRIGNAYYDLGELNEAISAYQNALILKQDFVEAYFNMGKAFHDQGKPDEAISAYQNALALDPEMVEALYNLGIVFHEQNYIEAAISYYRHALEVKPDFPAAYNNMGNAFQVQGRFKEAIACYEKALQLSPDYAEAYYNLGKTFHDLYDYKKALAFYQKALELRPDYAKAHCNMGRSHHNLGNFQEAITCYKKALEKEPEYAEAQFNLSITYLLTGNFKDGWKGYEWRLKRNDLERTHPYRHKAPRWNGSPFVGQTLLIHSEQGIGDTLQFARYLPMVKALGGYVIFELRGSLTGLFQDFPGVDKLIGLSLSDKKSDIEFDLCVPLLSLPGIFRTSLETIPAGVPYLHADPEKIRHWRDRMSRKCLKVGLVWAGNATYPNRSCPLGQFSALAQVKGVKIYGFQKGEAATQVNDDSLPEGFLSANFGEDFKDFTDTAAALHNLDLLISIDTSVAHLAGAMGKAVWVLLPFVPDWRWLQDREDSPWYPTMRLFRQKTPGDWATVIKCMAEELLIFAENRQNENLPQDISKKWCIASKHHQKGRLEAAEIEYRRILQIDADHSDALHGLGLIAYQTGKHEKAINLIRNAIDANPRVPCYYYNIGLAYTAIGQVKEAMNAFQEAVNLKPGYAEAYYNLGLTLKTLGRHKAASQNFQHAIRCDPGNADAYYNLGNTLKEMGEYETAIHNYRQAIRSRPYFPQAYNNLGLALKEQGQIAAAVEYYNRALNLKPDFAEARWNRSLALLLTGKFAQGWSEFEWRFQRGRKESIYPYDFKIPRWDGSSFVGKRLFIHSEQGLGDTLQFIRYLPMVKSRGGEITFETLPPLFGLLQGFPGIDKLAVISSDRSQAEECDFYVPLLSLPFLLETTAETIPAEIPYISADNEKVAYWQKMIVGTGFKVGLVWAGKPGHENDQNRSCGLNRFEILADFPGIRFYGLQKGEAASQVDDVTGRMLVANFNEELKDFTDTAGVIANLDLVISVDTAVAHLAGAMEKPVWLLLPFAPDWRWMLDREDSPWYRTMRIFRQEKRGDWDSVFRRVAGELPILVKEKTIKEYSKK
jgi:tetratricopeptide (TPR) repeat protein